MKYDYDKIHIGYFGLVETDGSFVDEQIVKAQLREGYSKEDAKWVHIFVSLGRMDEVSATTPTIKRRTLDAYKGRRIKFVSLKAIEHDPELRGRVAAFCASESRKPYPVQSLLFWLLPKWMRGKSNWLSLRYSRFCSALIDYGIIKGAFIDLWPDHEFTVMPSRFSADPRFREIDCLLKK